MKRRPALAAPLLMTLLIAPAQAHDIVRRANPAFPIANSVTVPSGADTVYLSGMLADVADPSAPAGSVERLGDTAAQATSVLGKIAAELDALGLSMADVV